VVRHPASAVAVRPEAGVAGVEVSRDQWVVDSSGSIGSNRGALVRRCRGILFRVTDAVAFRLFELVLEGRLDGAQVSGTIG
jgi:hypothetical protein